MTSIRRLLSGISTAATWAARYEVSAPIRHKPTAPIEPVRRGFSDHSDFQSAEEAENSPLGAHAPNLSGRSRKTQEALRVYAGLSDFQASLPRYQHLLGTHVPPPPNRYWEASRSKSAEPAAPRAQEASDSRARPGLAATAGLEQAFEQAGDEDSVLLYADAGGENGRSLLQHPDGSLSDPKDPKKRFANAQEWERANPGFTREQSLSRNDLELVLAMPEGEARDEILSELASAASAGASSTNAAAVDGFMPSLDDLPVETEPLEERVDSDAFMPSLDDLPGSEEEAPSLSPEDLEGLLSPTGGLAEGQSPLGVAGLVALRGTPEMQARVATTLYERVGSPGTELEFAL